jgi:hypothetical protein
MCWFGCGSSIDVLYTKEERRNEESLAAYLKVEKRTLLSLFQSQFSAQYFTSKWKITEGIVRAGHSFSSFSAFCDDSKV